jgi:hypothetical protein
MAGLVFRVQFPLPSAFAADKFGAQININQPEITL